MVLKYSRRLLPCPCRVGLHLGEGVKDTGRGLLRLQRFAVRRERIDAVTPVLLIDVLIRTRGDHVIHLCGQCCATRKRQRHRYNERPYDVTLELFTSMSSYV